MAKKKAKRKLATERSNEYKWFEDSNTRDGLYEMLELQEQFAKRLTTKYKAKVTKLEKEVKKLKACECDNCRIKRNLDKQIKVRTDGLQL